MEKTKRKTFLQKASQHWLIIVAAIFFDILALIPLLSVVFNFCFGLTLFLYFGPKKMSKTWWTIGIGSVFDSLLSILPVNTAAAIVRIAQEE